MGYVTGEVRNWLGHFKCVWGSLDRMRGDNIIIYLPLPIHLHDSFTGQTVRRSFMQKLRHDSRKELECASWHYRAGTSRIFWTMTSFT